MSDSIITVENLSKKYIVDHKLKGNRGHATLRDTISDGFKSVTKIFSKSASGADPEHEEFWALNDVSFAIQPGDRVGVIGRNGAGKSTLLKVLSRITEPTRGRVTIEGRVASLLEVGTGFHKELTGRENVFLNGAILGMSKVEIHRRFDEIVAFSGVEKFLDTPVKRYSSGMYVRLAFAVAAHLEPEILIVDEVLAVGDMEFQKKCLSKMDDVARSGRTVLLVSHNMASIQGLCNKGIMLSSGKLYCSGEITEVVNEYVSQSKTLIAANSIASRSDRSGNGSVRIQDIRFKDLTTQNWTNEIINGRSLLIEISYQAKNKNLPIKSFNLGITFHTNDGQFVSVVNSRMASNAYADVAPEGKVYCYIPKLPLMCGNYFLNFNLNVEGSVADQMTEATSLNVEPGDYFGTGIDNAFGRQGVYLNHSWGREDDFFLDGNTHIPA
jgi:lipopolysaccharide transport system ATP-binding protein